MGASQVCTSAHPDRLLQNVLRARGWVSERYARPEYSDEFEWAPSTPTSGASAVASGTVIYLEPGVYWVFAPQDDDRWRPPRAVYGCRHDLLAEIETIETWRDPAPTTVEIPDR